MDHMGRRVSTRDGEPAFTINFGVGPIPDCHGASWQRGAVNR